MTMKYHKLDSRPRSRVKQKSNTFLYIGCGLVTFFVIFFYFYTQQKNSHSDSINQESLAGSKKIESGEHNAPSNGSAVVPSQSEKSGGKANDPSVSMSSPSGDMLSSRSEINRSVDGHLFSDPENNPPFLKTNSDNLIQTLNNFYKHLDQQSYMKEFKLKEPSRIHFSNLLQKLINNPPVVTNETDDLYTLLKNTAHFFRIIGKENILILKGILDREKSSFENTLKTFYSLTAYPEVTAREYSLILPENALYDYAGFFLNTMGGRLYLFRRDSISRMTVSYYSILLIDNANDEGYNRYGIDIRPAIDSLIDEIEGTGNRLLLREEYLDTLYDLKEKYN